MAFQVSSQYSNSIDFHIYLFCVCVYLAGAERVWHFLPASTGEKLNPWLNGMLTNMWVLVSWRMQTFWRKDLQALSQLGLILLYDVRLLFLLYLAGEKKRKKTKHLCSRRKCLNGAWGSSRAIWTVELVVITETNGIN